MKNLSYVLIVLAISFGISTTLIVSIGLLFTHAIISTSYKATTTNATIITHRTERTLNVKEVPNSIAVAGKPTNQTKYTSNTSPKNTNKSKEWIANNLPVTQNSIYINNGAQIIKKISGYNASRENVLKQSVNAISNISKIFYNNTFSAKGSIASLLFDTKGSSSNFTNSDESNDTFNVNIAIADNSSSLDKGIGTRFARHQIKTYNLSSQSDTLGSIVDSNIFARTMDPSNTTFTNQNLDDSMINLLTNLILNNVISKNHSKINTRFIAHRA